MLLPILLLSAAGFTVLTTEFVIVGLLPSIARDLNVSVSQAGLLVTLFAFIACAIGVRDHLHVAVNAVYNQLPVGGKARKALDVLTDVVVLLCGLFMLYSGGARTIKLFGLPGVLPITGISTAWQYLPIPVAGFVMSFDSILFLTGIISRDDLLYSEPEVDFTDEAAVAAMAKEAEKK